MPFNLALRVMSYHFFILYCPVLCYAMLCYAMRCDAMLCYATSCFVNFDHVLYYDTLHNSASRDQFSFIC
jgi:hypothetical protein